MYKKQLQIKVMNDGYLNKFGRVDFKYEFLNGEHGKLYKIKFFEVRKMELEEIIDYMTDILDYSKYLKKIEEIKKTREYEILALRIKEIAIKKKIGV